MMAPRLLGATAHATRAHIRAKVRAQVRGTAAQAVVNPLQSQRLHTGPRVPRVVLPDRALCLPTFCPSL